MTDSAKSVAKTKDKLRKTCKHAAESSELTFQGEQEDREHRAGAVLETLPGGSLSKISA